MQFRAPVVTCHDYCVGYEYLLQRDITKVIAVESLGPVHSPDSFLLTTSVVAGSQLVQR